MKKTRKILNPFSKPVKRVNKNKKSIGDRYKDLLSFFSGNAKQNKNVMTKVSKAYAKPKNKPKKANATSTKKQPAKHSAKSAANPSKKPSHSAKKTINPQPQDPHGKQKIVLTNQGNKQNFPSNTHSPNRSTSSHPQSSPKNVVLTNRSSNAHKISSTRTPHPSKGSNHHQSTNQTQPKQPLRSQQHPQSQPLKKPHPKVVQSKIKKDYLNQTISLQSSNDVGSGGEGAIYLTNRSGTVAKIFNDKYRKKSQAKIEYITGLFLDINRVVLPKSILYKNNTFIGYTMDYLGKDYKTLTSIFTPARIEHFKQPITYSFLLGIALNLTHIVNDLHQHKVIIGDMKPENIMVSRKGVVKVIDADSFQYSSKFLCNTLTTPYVPRDQLTNSQLTKHIRDWHYDSYSLMVIIFQILTLGSHPYDRLFGSDLMSNIKAGYYQYPHPSNPNPNLKFTRKDVYNVIRANFSESLQFMFYNHFHTNGKAQNPQNRMHPSTIGKVLTSEIQQAKGR